MTISERLDEREAEGIDVSHIVVPDELTREEDPEETIYFKQIRPCSVLCTGRHPFAAVERFYHWYYCRGRKKEAGTHTTQPLWGCTHVYILKDSLKRLCGTPIPHRVKKLSTSGVPWPEKAASRRLSVSQKC